MNPEKTTSSVETANKISRRVAIFQGLAAAALAAGGAVNLYGAYKDLGESALKSLQLSFDKIQDLRQKLIEHGAQFGRRNPPTEEYQELIGKFNTMVREHNDFIVKKGFSEDVVKTLRIEPIPLDRK